MKDVDHTHIFLTRLWYANLRIAYVAKAYFCELYEACCSGDPDRVERLVRDHCIDIAG